MIPSLFTGADRAPDRRASRAGAGLRPRGAAATGGRCCPRDAPASGQLGDHKGPFLLPEMSHRSHGRGQSQKRRPSKAMGEEGSGAAGRRLGVTLDSCSGLICGSSGLAGTAGKLGQAGGLVCC